MVTFEDVKNSPEINLLLTNGQRQLDVLKFTEHSIRHATVVSKIASIVLTDLGYDERTIELGKIAGYMHDIGNSINRNDHPHSSAVLAYQILKEMGMDIEEVSEIAMAIGHHDEKTGAAVSVIASALIIGDKCDVHRGRVRTKDLTNLHIHDRVNYAVEKSRLSIDKEEKKMTLKIEIDTSISSVMDYFEISLGRMNMIKEACNYLGYVFELIINDTKLN